MWTDQVDIAVREGFADAGAPGGVAVVALGGYARRELCPDSDVDLLLVHVGLDQRDLSDLVTAVCYPLWDAGLSVGHAVHRPRDAIRAAKERIDTATAILERRGVVGESGLLDDLAGRTRSWVRQRRSRLLVDLTDADRARHLAAGPRAGLLEPDLKSGAGGLRDLHSLRWASALLIGRVGLDPLVTGGYLSAGDRAALAQAGRTLMAARCALHLVGGNLGGRPDVLRLDLQDEVADRLGLASGDELARQVGLATRTIAHLHARTWPAIAADGRGGRRRQRAAPQPVGGGVHLVDGLVTVDPGLDLRADPAAAWRAIAVAARGATRLGRTGAERLRTALTSAGTLGWDDETRAHLLEVLRAGEAGSEALADADHLGVLAAHLPEWPRVRGHPQRNPYHRYDLDTHLRQTVARLVEIADGVIDATHRQVAARLEHPDELLVGALLHDVGKAWPGDHSIVGAEIASRWVRHMGFGDAAVRRIAHLVRHHLLLPDVATRRNLEDPEVIGGVAQVAGDPEALDWLYLLSLADARATGPSAHSAWKESLLATLHARVRRLLCDDAAGLAAELAPDTVLVEVRDRVGPGVEGARALEALASLPEAYLQAVDADLALVHLELLEAHAAHGRPGVRLDPGPAAGTVTATLVARDRTGLFADATGTLATLGATVLEARVFTVTWGGAQVALDWFVLQDLDASTAERLPAAVGAAVEGRADVAAGIDRRERRRDARLPPLVSLPAVRVRVDVDAHGGTARVEVTGPDTPGVLFRLVRAIADAGCSVVLARVATLGPEVRDAFVVELGRDLLDVEALTAALHEAAEVPDQLRGPTGG